VTSGRRRKVLALPPPIFNRDEDNFTESDEKDSQVSKTPVGVKVKPYDRRRKVEDPLNFDEHEDDVEEVTPQKNRRSKKPTRIDVTPVVETKKRGVKGLKKQSNRRRKEETETEEESETDSVYSDDTDFVSESESIWSNSSESESSDASETPKKKRSKAKDKSKKTRDNKESKVDKKRSSGKQVKDVKRESVKASQNKPKPPKGFEMDRDPYLYLLADPRKLRQSVLLKPMVNINFNLLMMFRKCQLFFNHRQRHLQERVVKLNKVLPNHLLRSQRASLAQRNQAKEMNLMICLQVTIFQSLMLQDLQEDPNQPRLQNPQKNLEILIRNLMLEPLLKLDRLQVLLQERLISQCLVLFPADLQSLQEQVQLIQEAREGLNIQADLEGLPPMTLKLTKNGKIESLNKKDKSKMVREFENQFWKKKTRKKEN
jgi:hypothetical protein